MNYGFIGFYIQNALKGKNIGVQKIIASILLLFSFITIPGIIRFLSGGYVHRTDFFCCVILIYGLMNFFFVVLSTLPIAANALANEQAQTVTTENIIHQQKTQAFNLLEDLNYSQITPESVPPTRKKEDIVKSVAAEKDKKQAATKTEESGSNENIGDPPDNDWDEQRLTATYVDIAEEKEQENKIKQEKYFLQKMEENPMPEDDRKTPEDIDDLPNKLEEQFHDQQEIEAMQAAINYDGFQQMHNPISKPMF